MKSLMNHIVVLVVLGSVFSCSKGDNVDISEPEVILQPESPTLSFPLNNEPCLDTSEINDTQSSVDFRWNTAVNAVSYKIIIQNLSTSVEQQFTSLNNEQTIILQSAEPYSWKVRAIGKPKSTPAESDTWQFYLPGPREINYAPFPAELTGPISGSTVTPIDGIINLQWTCIDSDNDIVSFNIYLDTQNASTLIETLPYSQANTVLETVVENTTLYYWKVIAIDAQGNESDSGVYTFRTN